MFQGAVPRFRGPNSWTADGGARAGARPSEGPAPRGRSSVPDVPQAAAFFMQVQRRRCCCPEETWVSCKIVFIEFVLACLSPSAECSRVCLSVSVCVSVCVSLRVCVSVLCARACVRVCVYVRARVSVTEGAYV